MIILSGKGAGRLQSLATGGGVAWSASEGILSAVRPADEVPGSGSGVRVLQLRAPVAPGSSGGPLLKRSGALIDIIISKSRQELSRSQFESVWTILDSGHRMALGSGSFF